MGDVDPRLGTVLGGNFRLERVLGEGAMGVVYEATDTTLARRVAIKVARRELVRDPVIRERLLREARAAAALGSEHVTRIFHAGLTDDGAPFVAMELLRGESLEARLARGQLPVADVVTWIAQAARGLAEAHARGLVHRDVKPANLFLAIRNDGSTLLKVLDFGIVRATDPDVVRLTATGEQPGSPAYLSPEQIRGAVADARADVWALGVTLFEALTGGTLPFDGKNVTTLLRNILEAPPTELATLRPDVPDAVAAVVRRCLEKDPDRRFPDAAAVEAALRVHSSPKNTVAEVRHVVRVASATPPPVRQTEGRRWVFALSALLVVALGGVLIVGLGKLRPEARVEVSPTPPPASATAPDDRDPVPAPTASAEAPATDASSPEPLASGKRGAGVRVVPPVTFGTCRTHSDCPTRHGISVHSCNNGQCECAARNRLCNGVCVDPKFDPDHCGRCGTFCKADEACLTDREGSRCVPCNGGGFSSLGDGEKVACGAHHCVNLANDSEHCGTCGKRCAAHERCASGKCEAKPR